MHNAGRVAPHPAPQHAVAPSLTWSLSNDRGGPTTRLDGLPAIWMANQVRPSEMARSDGRVVHFAPGTSIHQWGGAPMSRIQGSTPPPQRDPAAKARRKPCRSIRRKQQRTQTGTPPSYPTPRRSELDSGHLDGLAYPSDGETSIRTSDGLQIKSGATRV